MAGYGCGLGFELICPLAALFLGDARALDGGTALAAKIARVLMVHEDHSPEQFYRAWDKGTLSTIELRAQVEVHLTGERAERDDSVGERLRKIRDLV